MANPLSAMLDELMGRNRNANPGEAKTEPKWDDPDVCPFFIAGYCPHEMFVNTKADLGPCRRVHDEKLREDYKKSSRFEKVGLEDDFLNFLQKVQSDMQRKIDRNKQRLDLTQPGGQVEDADKEQISEKMAQLTEKIAALLSQAEQLGEKGQVEEAQSVVQMMEELREERDRLQENFDSPSNELRSMEVCDICGCFLVMNDAQHRLDEHFTGKQHLGFAKIKITVDELLRKRQERREQREKEEKQRHSSRHSSRSSSHHRRNDKDDDLKRSSSKKSEDRHRRNDDNHRRHHHSSSKDRRDDRKSSKKDRGDKEKSRDKRKRDFSEEKNGRSSDKKQQKSRDANKDQKSIDNHKNNHVTNSTPPKNSKAPEVENEPISD